MGTPVTVAITRHAGLEHSDEVLAWIRAGFALAEQFPGFLGSGWVRSAPEDDAWHLLCRFADAESLAAWESSSQRRWWLGAAQGIVGEARVQRMTGIEGWFDPPSTHDVEYRGAGPGVLAAPPRWKQAVVIFSVFLPLSLALNMLALHTIGGLPLPLRVLCITAVATPLMVYAGLPWATRVAGRWLHAGLRPAR